MNQLSLLDLLEETEPAPVTSPVTSPWADSACEHCGEGVPAGAEVCDDCLAMGVTPTDKANCADCGEAYPVAQVGPHIFFQRAYKKGWTYFTEVELTTDACSFCRRHRVFSFIEGRMAPERIVSESLIKAKGKLRECGSLTYSEQYELEKAMPLTPEQFAAAIDVDADQADAPSPSEVITSVIDQPAEPVTGWDKAEIEAEGIDGLADTWAKDQVAQATEPADDDCAPCRAKGLHCEACAVVPSHMFDIATQKTIYTRPFDFLETDLRACILKLLSDRQNGASITRIGALIQQKHGITVPREFLGYTLDGMGEDGLIHKVEGGAGKWALPNQQSAAKEPPTPDPNGYAYHIEGDELLEWGPRRYTGIGQYQGQIKGYVVNLVWPDNDFLVLFESKDRDRAEAFYLDQLQQMKPADLQAERARFVGVLSQTLAKAQRLRAETQAEITAYRQEQKTAPPKAKKPVSEPVSLEQKAEPAAWTGADLHEALITTLQQASGSLNAGELQRAVAAAPWRIVVDEFDLQTALKSLIQSGLIERHDARADGLCTIVFRLNPAEPGDPISPALILGALAHGPLSREALLALCPDQPGAMTLALESLWMRGRIAIDGDGLTRRLDLTPAAETDVLPAELAGQPEAFEREEERGDLDLDLEKNPDLSPPLSLASLPEGRCLYHRCKGVYLPRPGERSRCSLNPVHEAWPHAQAGYMAYVSYHGYTYCTIADWLSGAMPQLGPEPPAKQAEPDWEGVTRSAEVDVQASGAGSEAMRPAHPLYPMHYELPAGQACAYCGGELALAEDRPDVWYCQTDRAHRLWASGIGSGVWLDVSRPGVSQAVKLPAPEWMGRAQALAAKWAQEATEKEAAKQQTKLQQKELKAA